MLNKTYWKASSSYTAKGLLLPTAKNVYQNTAIVAGQPIDKSIATSWFRDTLSTITLPTSNTAKHNLYEYNIFTVFSNNSGNGTVTYDYAGAGLKYSGSNWDVTRFVCGIDTSIVNLYIPVYLFGNNNATVSAIEFITNFDSYKDYNYAIIGKPILSDGTGELSVHFIIEAVDFDNNKAGGILQFTSVNAYSSVSNHQWSSPTFAQFNGYNSNTSVNRYVRITEALLKSDAYPYKYVLPYASAEIEDNKDINSYEQFSTSFENYYLSEKYSNYIRGCWKPAGIYNLLKHVGVPLRTTNIVTSDTKIYIPLVDESGYHSGEWVLSTDKKAKDSSLYKTQTDQNTIDPTKPPTPDENDDIEPVGYGYFSNTALGTLCALKNKLDIEKISQWLLTQTEGVDVAKNIVSIKEIPFSLSTLGLQPLDIPLTIGGHNVTYGGSDLIVGEIVAPTIPTLNLVFADFDIPRLSNTYLDYNPYTKYELLLPFAPSPITLPDWVIEKNVKAIFLYDIYTTACQYIIICNNERICAVSGTFGIDRAIAAQNVALRDSARLSAQLGTASSVIGGVISGAVGNINGVASGAISGISAINQYINAGKQNYMYTIGANSDSSSVGLYHAAHLKITRTLSIEDESYNHTYGRPLCKTRQLSNVSGFTICGNADTSSINTATTAERNAIQQLLTSGVYL